MDQMDYYHPAVIGEKCKAEIDRLEAEMSKANKKDIILVAYEKQ